MWNRDLLDRPEAYADALDRWLDYYRRLGIEQLGYACLVLRKRGTAATANSCPSRSHEPRFVRPDSTCDDSSRRTTGSRS